MKSRVNLPRTSIINCLLEFNFLAVDKSRAKQERNEIKLSFSTVFRNIYLSDGLHVSAFQIIHFALTSI